NNVIALCDALQELGEYSEAKLKYEELLIKKSISEENLFNIYKQIGNLSVRDGDLEAAEEYYNKAFSIDSKSDTLLVNFGTLEMQRGDYEKALIRFREAIEINKSNAKAWIGLGMIHRKYGDHELSIANIVCALDLEPENKTALKLYSDWSVHSSCIQSACERLEAYLEKNDQDVEFILIYAKLNFILGKIDKAKLEAEKAFSLEPENIDTLEFINIVNKKI
ncbi:MAG: tetratricopeptide repeat protein, partial [Ignavibacteriae bacterium]|nr:tetratricopeptide repeat protein [Ignavibacteriota bacterium]